MHKPYVLGINPCINGMNYHDPSVCLMQDGKIVFAIEEERLNGIKHSKGLFPERAVDKCREYATDRGGDISKIAIGYSPILWKKRLVAEILRSSHSSGLAELLSSQAGSEHQCLVILEETIYDFSDIIHRMRFNENPLQIAMRILSRSNLPTAEVLFYEHHLAHAASAYYTSSFDSALCFVIDGTGEYASLSVWKAAKGNPLVKLHEDIMPNSLGYFYASATAFAGFEPWSEEGKLMALAPYGHKNDSISEALLSIVQSPLNHYDVSSFVGKCLGNGLAIDINRAKASIQETLGVSARQKDEEINDWFKDFAFEVQNLTEIIVKRVIDTWIRETGIEQVCVAGGLFMNCKMNMFLRENTIADKLYVQPVAGDAGVSLGAAILASENLSNSILLDGLSLGLEYDDDEIEPILQKTGIKYRRSNNIEKEVASLLLREKIVCWFQGKSEFGSRALGHRSILASPIDKKMALIVNQRVKHREEWRPFACSILEEFADKILEGYDDTHPAPYMIEAFKVKREWQEVMGAVLHSADMTTRPQIVPNRSGDQKFYSVIHEFYMLSNVPLVLNTSLNDKGQPIITTPWQAIEYFILNDIDAMALNNFLLIK